MRYRYLLTSTIASVAYHHRRHDYQPLINFVMFVLLFCFLALLIGLWF